MVGILSLIILLINGLLAWIISTSIVEALLGNSPFARLAKLIIGVSTTLWFVVLTAECITYGKFWYSGFVVLGPTGLILLTMLIGFIHDYMYKNQN